MNSLKFILFWFFNITFVFSVDSILEDPYVHSLLSQNNFYKDKENLPCDLGPPKYRAGIRYTSSEGIGLQKGYTTIESFNVIQREVEGGAFIDARAHVFDDGKWAANAGVGLRCRFDQTRCVVGGNFYYDYRRNKKKNFHQIGAGFELLGEYVNFRTNGYIPVGQTKKFTKISFNRFTGNQLIGNRNYRLSMFGGDAELEGKILNYKNFKLKTGLGTYYYKGTFGKQAWGVKGRFNIEIFKVLGGMIRAFYDNLFKFNIQGEARVSASFGPRVKQRKQTKNSDPTYLTCKQDYSMMQRLVEPVQRQEIVVLSDQKKSFVAMDNNCLELFFYHVDNSSLGANLGTFEDPFTTLAAAETASINGNFIYVQYGSGGSTGMSDGITLKDDQSLLGSGDIQEIDTSRGIVLIPLLSSNLRPSITDIGSAADGVILANGNTVSGFKIVSPEGNGIRSTNPIRASKIKNNEIINTGSTGGTQGGIFIDLTPGVDVAGTFEIKNNVLLSSEGGNQGIRIDCSGVGNALGITLDINNNQIIGNRDEGIFVLRASGASNCSINGKINNNDISANNNNGISFDHTGGGTASMILDLTIEQNSIIGNQSEGIHFDQGRGNLRILNNVYENNTSDGLFIETIGSNILNLNVTGNRFVNNSGSNVEIESNDTSLINAVYENNISTGEEIIFDSNGSSTIRVKLDNNTGTIAVSGNVILEE